MPFTSADPASVKEIECVICLEPWDKPVELQPCRHVFCERCASSLRQCPECRATIAGRKQPNRILVNLAEGAQMKCETCQWIGTREQSRTHRCSDARQQQRPPPPGPAPRVPSPQAVPAPAAAGPSPGGMQRPPQLHDPRADAIAVWEAYGLQQDEYDHIMTVFLTFDTDDSGELDRRELTTLCRWLNYAHGERDIDAMFRAMDTDGSGALSMDEFCRWISTHRPDPQALYGMTPVEYNEALFQFHTYDRDQNGTLDEDEFVGLAVRQGYARNEHEARALFRRVDADRSGTIDLHELLTFRAQHLHPGQRSAPPPPQPVPQPQPSGNYGSYYPQQHQAPPPGPQGYPPPPQSYPPAPQDQQQYWQVHHPAPAPTGEQLRYQGGHAAQPAHWQPQQQQQQQQQPYGSYQPPPPPPPQSYPPQHGQSQAYDPSRPYPQAQAQPHQRNDGRRKDKGDCVVA